LKEKLKKFLPWIFTAAIFALLFKQVPPAGVFTSIKLANIPLFVFYSLVYFSLMMLVDCAGLKWAISRFSTPVSFIESTLMRGATYLLMLVNYNVGQGGMALYLKRTHGAPIFKTLGTVFFLTVVDLTIIIGPALITALKIPIEYKTILLNPLIIRSGAAIYTGLLLWIALWQLLKSNLGEKLRQQKWMSWVYERQLFYAFREAGLKDYLKIYALRIPPLLLVAFSFFFWSHSFRIPLPLPDIFVYAPIILIVGTLPLTPGGVGAVQFLCIKLFHQQAQAHLPPDSPVSAEQILLAASLLWGVANAVLKLIFGLYCLSKKSRSLFLEETAPDKT